MFLVDLIVPNPKVFYTGMDKTSLETISGSLFVTHSGCPRHVERNYAPLLLNVDLRITYHCSAWHNGTSTYVIT